MTMASGFFKTAASAQEVQGSTAENEQPAYLREFADMCERLWKKLGKQEHRSLAVDGRALEQDDNPYKAFWFRKCCGDQVYDCGNCIHLSGTNKEPVTDLQIVRMVEAANNRKDPPWETLYMFNHKGKPDLEMAHRVQSVIDKMREAGRIPPDCRISCCTDPAEYPKNIRNFGALLADAFKSAAQDDKAPAPTNSRAGFHHAPA